MEDRRYPRARSPPLQPHGRSSLPSFGYPYASDFYPPPPPPQTRHDSLVLPRSGPPPVTTTTYQIKPDVGPVRKDGEPEGRRHRRSTLDGSARPNVINAQPRAPAIHGGAGGAGSPVQTSLGAFDEGGEYYSIPASSGRRRGHQRGSYSATMDNADMSWNARPGGSLTVGRGREGARYPTRSKPVYPGALVRRADTVADDYGDDGYGYTNPRDLFEYDMSRGARYAPPRRDSYEASRKGRPLSISGYADMAPPRSYDARGRGPPPTTRGLDKLATRAPAPPYDLPPPRPVPAEPGLRSPRREQFYEPESPRKYSSRRPVSVYQERPRRDDYYDPRDDDRRERREKAHGGKRREDEQRGLGGRGERGDLDGYDWKRDNDRKEDYDDHDDRVERKSGREKGEGSRKDHDRSDGYEDHRDRKSGRDKVATNIGVAAAALGVGAAAALKGSRRDDSDDESDSKDRRDEARRRRDGEEHRKRREAREDRESVDLAGRDPKERVPPKEPPKERRDVAGKDGTDPKERSVPAEEKPVDLNGRNPQEKVVARDPREEAQDAPEGRKDKADPVGRAGGSDSRDEPPIAADGTGPNRIRKSRGPGPGPDAAFDPKNINDVRALKEALSKQDAPAPPVPAKVPLREGSYERRDPRDKKDERADRDERRRGPVSDSDESEDASRPPPQVVSPPEEARKLDEKPKGILRPPRERFPEDPVPIREGVAPLKDARKDGVPPDARWTKISRRMVNPEALDVGKERYEAREDFVIVLRVLTKEEIQAYAVATQQIRAVRDQLEELEEREKRQRRRRERHERHKRERERLQRERGATYEYDHEHRRHKREPNSHSESDTTEADEEPQKLLDAPKSRRLTFDGPDGKSRDDPSKAGAYPGPGRNAPRRF